MARLVRLSDDLHAGPLDRPRDHRLRAARDGGQRAGRRIAWRPAWRCWPTTAIEVTFERVHVLAEQPGRIWVPVADAALGRG